LHSLFLTPPCASRPLLPAAAVITGTRTRKSQAVAVAPMGWSTAQLVAKCVQPALGATRLSYVQVGILALYVSACVCACVCACVYMYVHKPAPVHAIGPAFASIRLQPDATYVHLHRDRH